MLRAFKSKKKLFKILSVVVGPKDSVIHFTQSIEGKVLYRSINRSSSLTSPDWSKVISYEENKK